MAKYAPAKPRLSKAITRCKANLWAQQFGQSNDTCVWNGATACTHVVCQILAIIWKNKKYTLNQVNSIAGVPCNARNGRRQPRGMNNTELQRFFNRAGLPYVIRFGLSFQTLMSYSNKAPVFYGNRYGSEPEWRGYSYAGHRANSPYALYGGKTQLAGFENGAHAVLLLGYRAWLSDRGKPLRYDAWRKDPNHNSPSRPENPPFHKITTSQAKKEYDDYRRVFGRNLYAAIPTRNLPTAAGMIATLAQPDEMEPHDRFARMLRPEYIPDNAVEPTEEDWGDGSADDAVPEDDIVFEGQRFTVTRTAEPQDPGDDDEEDVEQEPPPDGSEELPPEVDEEAQT